METPRTSSTDPKTAGKPPVPGTVHEVMPFDPLDEFVFSIQDPNAVTRDNIATVAREVFGRGPESADFIAKLVEHMLSVSESRSKIVAELVILGGHLQQMMKSAISHHTGAVGNTFQARRKAAKLCFDFFHKSLGITRPSAYNYIRCHQKFADNAEAMRIFSFGELNLLAAQDVTDEQITAIMQKKAADPKMTRHDVAEMLKALQRQEEAIADRDRQLENIEGLLADNKIALDVSIRDNNHLREQIAAHEGHLAEQEKSIANLHELLASRTSGYPAMEQELAAKDRQLKEATAELNALRNAKPKVEKVEVPVDKIPEAYENLEQAVEAALAELNETRGKKSALESEIAQLEASIAAQQVERDAASAVKNALEELMTAWGEVAGKMATVQLAVQASRDPEQYNPTLEALAATLRKYLTEIEAALKRKPR